MGAGAAGGLVGGAVGAVAGKALSTVAAKAASNTAATMAETSATAASSKVAIQEGNTLQKHFSHAADFGVKGNWNKQPRLNIDQQLISILTKLVWLKFEALIAVIFPRRTISKNQPA
nr:hypothetical protein [Leifsonia xyli]